MTGSKGTRDRRKPTAHPLLRMIYLQPCLGHVAVGPRLHRHKTAARDRGRCGAGIDPHDKEARVLQKDDGADGQLARGTHPPQQCATSIHGTHYQFQ